MAKSYDLGMVISKYLKYLCFSQTLAPLTISSYIGDLMELFQLKKVYRLKIDQNTGNFAILPNGKSPSSRTSEQWALLARESLREKDLSRNSLKRQLCSLRRFVSWAEGEGFEIPLKLHESIGAQRKIPSYLSVDEILHIKSYLEKDPGQPKNQGQRQLNQQRLLFTLLYGSGLRVSEACFLKAQNVHWDRKEVVVLGKGGQERVAILSNYGTEQLKINQNQFDLYIWGESPLPQRTAYHRISQLGIAAGLSKKLHPHMFRHSYATHLINSGANLRVIQNLLGHKSLSATEIYTHLEHNSLARSLEKNHPLAKK